MAPRCRVQSRGLLSEATIITFTARPRAASARCWWLCPRPATIRRWYRSTPDKRPRIETASRDAVVAQTGSLLYRRLATCGCADGWRLPIRRPTAPPKGPQPVLRLEQVGSGRIQMHVIAHGLAALPRGAEEQLLIRGGRLDQCARIGSLIVGCLQRRSRKRGEWLPHRAVRRATGTWCPHQVP
jgi:hypothetical protein